MNPNHQEEEGGGERQPTFETTMTNVVAIQRDHAWDEQDWPQYKPQFMASLKSGNNLTQRVVNVEADVKYNLVRTTPFNLLKKDVDKLMAAANERRSFLDRWSNRLWMLFLALMGWALGHWVH